MTNRSIKGIVRNNDNEIVGYNYNYQGEYVSSTYAFMPLSEEEIDEAIEEYVKKKLRGE